MDITKHLVKPVEVEVLGEKIKIKPLRTKHYLITSRYSYLALKAKKIAEDNKKNGTMNELSKEDCEELMSLDLELSYLTLAEISPELTKEQFDELPQKVVQEVMNAFWKVNDPSSEELEAAKKELLDG